MAGLLTQAGIYFAGVGDGNEATREIVDMSGGGTTASSLLFRVPTTRANPSSAEVSVSMHLCQLHLFMPLHQTILS